MKFLSTLTMLAATIAMANSSFAQTEFSFEDSEGAITALNGVSGGNLIADGITLNVSATAQEFDGAGVLTDETVTALTFVDTANGIGVDNPTINDADFEIFTGNDDTESEFISAGESLVLSFDQAVIVNAFNFFGVNSDETITVTVSSEADPFTFGSSGGSDNNPDPFGEGFELAVGETISFGDVVNDAGDVARYSLETITVTAVASGATGIPEPTSLAVLSLGGLAILSRRRRV